MTDRTTPEQLADLMDAMDYDDTRASAAMLRTLSAQRRTSLRLHHHTIHARTGGSAVTFELSQSFIFEAAHTLKRAVPLAEYQGSMRIHGHTYTAEVCIAGERGKSGMLEIPQPGKRKSLVVDLFVLKDECDRIRQRLDHHFLDEVPGLDVPTLEGLCVFIASEVGKRIPVHTVTVSRIAGDKCRYTPQKDHP